MTRILQQCSATLGMLGLAAVAAHAVVQACHVTSRLAADCACMLLASCQCSTGWLGVGAMARVAALLLYMTRRKHNLCQLAGCVRRTLVRCAVVGWLLFGCWLCQQSRLCCIKQSAAGKYYVRLWACCGRATVAAGAAHQSCVNAVNCHAQLL